MTNDDWKLAEKIANEKGVKVSWADGWYLVPQEQYGLKENAVAGPFDSVEAAFRSLLLPDTP